VFGEVAAFGGDLPLVVGLDQDGAGQAEQGGGVGEDADDVGAAFDFLVEPLERVGRPDLLPVREGVPVNARRSSWASRSIASTWGSCLPSIAAMTSNCSWTCSASGWAKMVRIAAATISWLPLGTTTSTKC
jgi:hypothetical protein